jgi:general nucleoside transport system permease protein
VSYLVHGPLIDPANYGYAWTLEVQKTAQLPIILKLGRINLGFVVALLCAAGAHVLLWHTTLGYEMRAVGAGMETARFGGIPVKRSMILSMLIGGGLAGLAGAAVILGVQLRLSDFFSPGYGFNAIAVALVGQTTPIGVVIAALFLGGLISGTNAVQRSVGVPSGIAFLVQGIMMLFVIASQSPAIIHWLRKQRMAQRADRIE